MNVLHINDYRTGGGCEVLVGATIDLLRERGVETSLFTGEDLVDQRMTPRRYLDNAVARAALRERLQSVNTDVVHLHNFYHVLSPGILAELAAWRQQRPCRVVMTAHDYHLVCPNSGGSWFRSARWSSNGHRLADNDARAMHTIDPQRVNSIAYLTTRSWDRRGQAHSLMKLAQHVWNYRVLNRRRVIDMVICPSRFMERLVRDAGLPAIRLPHPAPTLNASPLVSGQNRYGPLRLVFAGRIEPEKGLREFLRIMPAEFTGMITIIGEGSELESCQITACERGLNDRVEFLGRLPHAQTLAIIARCHVLVLPSLCLENYPLSVVEALAAGTNILVSDRGGMMEIVEQGNVGFTFTPGDPSSLAAAMRSIIAQHRDGSLNSFDVRTMLESCSEDAHATELLRLYRGERGSDSR